MPSVGESRTVPCPADCTGGTWSYTCPTNCSYPGGQVTATLTGYTPAVGTGSCVTTKQVTCPAMFKCYDYLSTGTYLTFNSSGLPSSATGSGWEVKTIDVNGKNYGGEHDVFEWSSYYDVYGTFNLNSYKLTVWHNYEYSWFPIRFRMVGVRGGGMADVLLHEFDLGTLTPWHYMYLSDYKGSTISSSSGQYATLKYVDTTGSGDWEMVVECGEATKSEDIRQIKFQIFSIQGRSDCINYGTDCRTYYNVYCNATPS